MRRLAAEIPDIFIPLARNDVRNDDDIFDSDVFPAGDSFTGSGVVRHACRLRRGGTRIKKERRHEDEKPTPLVPSTPVAARRRMTTPVVAPRSGFYPPNLKNQPPSCRLS